MNICLDTNAYTTLQVKNQSLCECVNEAEHVVIPLVVVGELFAGFECGNRKDINIKKFDEFCSLPGIKIVAPDLSTAQRYGIIFKILKTQGTPVPTNDIWIAATVLETGTRLVTYDDHFKVIPGIIIISP